MDTCSARLSILKYEVTGDPKEYSMQKSSDIAGDDCGLYLQVV